jgi:glycosyltransferase 2 family protein
LRIAAGAGILALVVWYADPAALWEKLRGTNGWLFAGAVLVATCANVLSALRWGVIARGLGLAAPTAPMIRMYARGIATNMLLPGATLSGDLLRSVQLSRLGNPFMHSALSVFLDRFSGLWVLCVLSLLAAAGVVAWGTGMPPGASRDQIAWYMLVLAGIACAPFVPLPAAKLQTTRSDWLRALARRWIRLHERLRGARPALIASVWQSLGVQFLSGCALWVCASAVGVSLSYPVVLAAAAPIFIMAAVPIGVAGFGARELAAVFVFGFLGVPGDQATATALLYGIAALIQGLAATPLFLTKA